MKIYRKEKGIPEPAEVEDATADKAEKAPQQAEQPQENAVKPEAQSQPAAQPQGMVNPMGQPQGQPAANFQMPPMTGAGQQGMTNPAGQPLNTADTSGQNERTDGTQPQSQQPAGPRGLFSQAPDPGHSSEEK